MKKRVATISTVVALGGLTGLALSAGKQAPSSTVADRPAVQTKVIRRTIHVTKHAKPKHPALTGAPTRAASGGPNRAYGSATTGSSSTGSAPSSSSYSPEPVTTSTSGGGSAPVSTGTEGVRKLTRGHALERLERFGRQPRLFVGRLECAGQDLDERQQRRLRNSLRPERPGDHLDQRRRLVLGGRR